MYCKHCGNQIPDDSRYCPICGQDLTTYSNVVTHQDPDYEASKLWIVLGFFVTWWIVLIVYLLIYKDKPKEANYLVKGWVYGLITTFVLFILMAVLQGT